MKKKILSTLLAGAAIATMGISGAQAATLDGVAGDIKFLFDGFDAAQATYDTSGIADGDTLCSTVAACDAAALGAPNAPGANQPNDTWGVTTVSAIESLGAGPFDPALWVEGQDGDILITYFSGFLDERVDRLSGTTTNVFSTGGTVDIYRVNAAFMAGLDLTDQASVEASFMGLSTYLELDFIPGCNALNPAATLCGTFDLATLHGVSNGSAEVVGGDAASKYQDIFEFEQTVEPCGLNVSCVGTSFNIVVRSGSATTTALPEPGALGLLGLGLVGMGLIARRRKA